MKDETKLQFTRTAANNNGGINLSIPPALVQKLNIQPGDTIALQAEHTEKHGPYASFWNQTKQSEKQ